MRILSILSAAAMCIAGLMMTSPASAAPLGAVALQAAAQSDSAAQQVHWRGYRHCHWRHGRRYCHGRRYGRVYGWPGVGIYVGPRHHHRHHWHRGHHRHH